MTNSQRMRLSAVMISSTIPSAKYSLVRVAAHICEWQHRDWWFVGQRRCSRWFGQWRNSELKGVSRLGDVAALVHRRIGQRALG
jgi:hypothetical protein